MTVSRGNDEEATTYRGHCEAGHSKRNFFLVGLIRNGRSEEAGVRITNGFLTGKKSSAQQIGESGVPTRP